MCFSILLCNSNCVLTVSTNKRIWMELKSAEIRTIFVTWPISKLLIKIVLVIKIF